MNAPAQDKPRLKISAKHIGPIMRLDAELSDNRQNLIFARNGTGKSFIARALRLLVPTEFSNEAEDAVPSILVSEESADQTGHFRLYEGETCIGGLGLDAKQKLVARDEAKYLYHVFSEDFVERHVRNRIGKLDGNITHEIVIGQENAELDEKKAELVKLRDKIALAERALSVAFEGDKEKLKADFEIVGSLGAYKSLVLGSLLSGDQPSAPPLTLPELLRQHNELKALPSDPSLPQDVSYDGLIPSSAPYTDALQEKTDPSTVADAVKYRIQSSPDFFEEGSRLFEKAPSNCPFCTRAVDEVALSAIDAYLKFFADAEAAHLRTIDLHLSAIQRTTKRISDVKGAALVSRGHFDTLKKFFAAMSDKELLDTSSQLDQVVSDLEAMAAVLVDKKGQLGVVLALPTNGLSKAAEDLAAASKLNGPLLIQLRKVVENSKAERLRIQSASCSAFLHAFSSAHGAEIAAILADRETLVVAEAEVTALSKVHGTKSKAKDRVVDTFQLLLRNFFADLYTFDAATFSVRRKQREIPRGPDRTLSDGEKSVLAFCYFIARIHLRIETNSDYKRVFLIIDDPVSSLSFDYVYGISQVLKCLRFTSDGAVELVMDPRHHKPHMLILTHNSYFYNVSSTNGVIKPSGLFQLISGDLQHSLKNQKGFTTPHLLQLSDVRRVSLKQCAPDHTTANSIRSVIEGTWKFVRPDLVDFEAFVSHVAKDCGLEVKSVLLNDLCHGGKFSDPPHQEAELILAAQEALAIVERFAPGQVKIVPVAG